MMTDTPQLQQTSPTYQQPRLLRALASIVSYIFHPIFMPVVLLLLLYRLAPVSFAGIPWSSFRMMLARVALNTLFFPLLSVLLLKATGFIKSIKMEDQKDRLISLIVIMIFYFWASHVFSNLPGVPLILRILLLGSFWGIIAIFLVSIFYKISMHTTAAGGMIGIMIILLFLNPINMAVPLFVGLFLAGLIGTARMVLSAHTPLEIWTGYLLGIVIELGAYLYLK